MRCVTRFRKIKIYLTLERLRQQLPNIIEIFHVSGFLKKKKTLLITDINYKPTVGISLTKISRCSIQSFRNFKFKNNSFNVNAME